MSTQPDILSTDRRLNQPRHAIKWLRGRRRPAASTGLPSASHPHRGKVSGWPARQENGLTLVGTQPLGAGPASSLYVSYGPCSSVPASGCHHRPVPDDRTGLPEQALNLFLLVVSPSGTRKTRTKFAFTLSGRSADNLESGRPDNPPVSLNHQPSIAVNHQPPIACPTGRSRLPNDNRPVAARPPPLAAMSPPAGTPFLTGTSCASRCVAPAAQHNHPSVRRQPASGHRAPSLSIATGACP